MQFYKIISFLYLLLSVSGFAQQKFKLVAASSQLLRNKLFVFGLKANAAKSELKVYMLTDKLKLADSSSFSLHVNSSDFLNLTSDTLHGFLNIYLQEKGKKQVSIYRFLDSLHLITSIEKTDISRVNFVNDLNKNLFYAKDKVYSLFSRQDSGYTQFYINSYRLKNVTKNFEYEQVWQFPFDRKNIVSAKIVEVKKSRIYVFVNVCGGKNHGKWLLFINTENGKLEHATRISDKSNFSTYEYGTCLYDTITSNIVLLGQKFTEKEFNSSTNNFSVKTNSNSNLYLAVIDSAGNLLESNDIKCPITDIKTGVKKVDNFYLLKPYDLKLTDNGDYNFKLDLFKTQNMNKCFRYCNTVDLKTELVDYKLKLQKAIIKTNLDIEKFYFVTDENDNNGKLCFDSIANFENLYFNPEISLVKLTYKIQDELPSWWLKKFDSKSSTLKLSSLKSNGNVFELSKPREFLLNTNPIFISIKDKLIVCAYDSESNFVISVY